MNDLKSEYNNWCLSKNDVINWQDDKEVKVYVEWCYKHNRIEFKASYVAKIQGVTYASSIDIIKSFIEKVGEDNFKKYVLGVNND